MSASSSSSGSTPCAFCSAVQLRLLEIELAERRRHPLGQRHDVGIGFLEDVDLDALHPVGARQDLTLLVRIDDRTEVPDRGPPVPRSVATMVSEICSQVLVLVEGTHQVLGASLLEGAAGEVDVLLCQAVDDRLDRDAGPAQRHLVQQDVDLLFQATADADGRDALDRFQGSLDLQIRDASQAPQALLTLEAIAAPRRGSAPGPGPARDRSAGSAGASASCGQEDQVQLFQDVLGRLGHVGVPGELQDDVADSGAADRC